MNDSTPWPDSGAEGRGTQPDAAESLRQRWLQGQRPDVGKFLAGFGPLPPVEVAAVLRVDQGHRWQSGEQILAEAYLLQHADVAAHIESALDLIYSEYLLRERSGEDPNLDDFLARFPEHAAVLRMQVELHQAIVLCRVAEEQADSPGEGAGPPIDSTLSEKGDANGRPRRGSSAELDRTQVAVPDPASEATRNTLVRALSPAPATEPGLPVVAGYEVLADVGRGGMGVIYKARQVGLNRLVALKMITAGELAGPAERARFRTEAAAVARLQHPHVVQIYEVGQHNGLPYLALEFMDRGSLASCLAGKPLAPRHAAELIETLARAVQAAHDQGIIHRDLKPANVLLATPARTPDPAAAHAPGVVELLGVPKITDFGLAKCLTDDGGQTTSGTILGTPNYMAPEQAEGQTRHVGPAADVYALGAILYEALTGRPPFVGGTLLETLVMVRSYEPVSPSRLLPNLPRDLVTVCLKALAKEPGRRYPSATALADDLRRFQGGLPVMARPVTPWERGWRWCGRNPMIASLSGGLAVLLIVLLVGLPAAALVRAERDKALANLERAEKAEAEALRAKQEVQIHSHLARAVAYRRSGQVGQRYQCLAELKEALRLQPSAELRREIRNEALAALILPDAEVARAWDGWPEGSTSIAWDASLKRYAHLGREGAVHVYRLTDTGVEDIARVPPQGSAASHIWMSPDARHVLFVHSVPREEAMWLLVVWRVDGTAPERVVAERVTASLQAVAFQPLGPRVAVARADRSVTLYDLDTGRQRRLMVPARPDCLAFRPDGGALAVAAGAGVYVFRMDQGKTKGTGPLNSRVLSPLFYEEAEPQRLRHGDKIKEVTHLAWHPDGRRLAAACDDLKIHLWDVSAAREVPAPWPAHANHGIQMAFNHAGDRLVSQDWNGQTRLCDAGSGQVLMTMPAACGLQFSPDDGLLGCQRSGNKLQLWRLTPGRELHVLHAPGGEGQQIIRMPTLHADGRVLGVVSSAGLGFHDLDSGAELASVGLPQPLYTYLRCFLPADGWLMSLPYGTLAWPARPDPDQAHVLRVGPPRQLDSRGQNGASASPDGRVVVMAHGNGAVLWHRDGTGRHTFLGPQRDVRETAVSPDQRWVATCSFFADPRSCVQIWDAATGRHVRDLPLLNMSYARFSPDSRRLATGTPAEGSRVWETGTWREVHRHPWAHIAFSPDRRTLAISDVLGQIRLVETETDREVVRLTGPEPLWYDPACFSPDGSRLIAEARDLRAVYVWDLRLLRQGLRELDLDWDGDEFPPAPAPSPPPEIRVDRGFLQQPTDFPEPRDAAAVYSLALAVQPFNFEAALQRGVALGRMNQARQAVADYSLFLTLAPAADARRPEVHFRRSNNWSNLKEPAAALDDLLHLATLDLQQFPWPGDLAKKCNEFAWRRAVKPEKAPSLEQALTLAQLAMHLEPGDILYRNTLGVVYYRLGRYQDAAATLEQNLHNNAGQAAFDLYFLAMAYHRLDQPTRARDAFTRAVHWHEEKKASLTEGYRTELLSFRAEAEALLK